MTETTDPAVQKSITAPQRTWPVVAAAIAGSMAVAAGETLLGDGPWIAWIPVSLVIVLGGLIAAHDIVSLTLPNRYTAGFAAAAGIQTIARAAIGHDCTILLTAAVTGAMLFAAYVAFGILGWVGFGDAKFAAGLGIAAATNAGYGAICILPIALLMAVPWRLAQTLVWSRNAKVPHGPSLAIATILVVVWPPLFTVWA